jgi:hypothetical protein
MIKLTEILNEYKVNKPTTYKYKVGEIVRELYGDEESCKILDRRPNWEAVISNPTNREYIFQHPYEDDNTINEPWYLIQWLEHNKDASPTWWTEEELQPYNNIDEYKINSPVTYKYKVGETVRERYSDEIEGEILDRRPNWVSVKANPIKDRYIQAALDFDKEYLENNEPWYLFAGSSFKVPMWYEESELQPLANINENIITNTNSEKKTISIDGYDNVSYKVMPNTKFVELRIDNSPQYRLQHDDALGYYPDNSLMSNTFKESVLNRIVKHLRERGMQAIVIDDTILMTNTNTLNENVEEYKVNAPDPGYKIADWVYKYFTEDPYDYDDERAEIELGPDEAMAMGILWRNMNIFDRNTVTKADIERWRNEPGNNLKDSTVDEILHYLTSLVLIKKAQSLNEYKINKPTDSLPSDFMNDVKDAINRHIVSLVKDHEEYYDTPAVEFVKDEKYGTHDTIIDFIKEHMVVNHYEFEKDGKEIIASPLNVSTISDEDVLDYLNDNIDLKRYINKVIWKAYFEAIDINEIRNKVFNYIKTKEHPDLPHTRNTKDYYDVYIPLLIEKVVDYYIEPSEIFNENDFVQQVNNTLLKSDFINEYKINKPSKTYKIADWVKYEYGMNDYHNVNRLYGEDVADACLMLNDIVDISQVETVNTNEIDTWLKSEVGRNMWIGKLDGLIDFLLKTDVIRNSNKINEYKVNKPNSGNYRISWYEGPDQFQQEKVETTFTNAEKLALDTLKGQYLYRKSYEYWAVIEQNLGDETIPRYTEIERINLDPEIDGLYANVRVYDETERDFVDIKTIKL